MKLEKSNVPSWKCVTGIWRGLSSAAKTSVNAASAEHTVASGAWNGGLMEGIIDGVKTMTFGDLSLLASGTSVSAFVSARSRVVKSGRNAWIVTIGWRR